MVGSVSTTEIELSSPKEIDLIVYRGDSGGFTISLKDLDGNPINISTATWNADIRASITGPRVIATFDIAPVVGDTSSVDILLSAENSALLDSNCVYDVQMTLDNEVTTLVKGSITVNLDVSR